MATQKAIPFKHVDSSLPANLNNTHRLKLYRRFMGRETLGGIKSLDVGNPGYISSQLRPTHNTEDCDFNFTLGAPGRNYAIVTNFEVINHLMNPLWHLCHCAMVLAPGGVMYLSHPKLWLVPFHHCRFDFVDYEVGRFIQMCEYAGFEVVRHETRNPWPFRFIFTGFRPIFRWLFNRIEIYELRKA